MFLDRQPDALRDPPFDTGGAVIGTDDHFVAAGLELALPEDQAAGAETQHGDHEGAVLLETSGLGVDGRHAETAPDA